MRGDDDPSAWSGRGQTQIRAVKERTAGSRFGMSRLLVRWPRETGLDLGQVEEAVIFAAHDVAQSSQVRKNGPIAILAIKSHDGLAKWERLCLHIGANRLHSLFELSAIVSVPCSRCSRERACPLMRVCLENGRARSEHFTSLASCIARGTDFVQAALCGWKIRRAGQGSLAGGLSRAINIKYQPVRSLPVPQSTRFLPLLQRASQQIFQKESA